jgi:hypothetical protein
VLVEFRLGEGVLAIRRVSGSREYEKDESPFVLSVYNNTLSNIRDATLRCHLNRTATASLPNNYDLSRTRDVLLLQWKSQAYVSTSAALEQGTRFFGPSC